MSEASTTLHEPVGRLSDRTIDLHRVLVSLQEELEAVDWYRQRADACRDDALRGILEHNMAEEIEHAAMILEWLRRNHPGFAGEFDNHLYGEGSITAQEVEHSDEAKTPEGAVVVDPRVGQIDVGQDLRIGYSANDGIHYKLFASESLVLLIDDPDAICTLT